MLQCMTLILLYCMCLERFEIDLLNTGVLPDLKVCPNVSYMLVAVATWTQSMHCGFFRGQYWCRWCVALLSKNNLLSRQRMCRVTSIKTPTLGAGAGQKSHLCLRNTLCNHRPAGLISMGAAKLPVKANKCKSCLAIKANSSNGLAPGFNLEHKSYSWQSERKHGTHLYRIQQLYGIKITVHT